MKNKMKFFTIVTMLMSTSAFAESSSWTIGPDKQINRVTASSGGGGGNISGGALSAGVGTATISDNPVLVNPGVRDLKAVEMMEKGEARVE